ncbi:TetR family transcriptional regulator [Actinoallomurus rhizosphaericola]|uniref:TetR family transcriptional regulator n=1 Tax=Actinoallomurus rhizosphaericola TaxID=2952536 RepID=UPI002092EF65|nr:TetR family transcriptional regulator [Actinoallomurus rhizosphaericola]MCO5998262.1 TetR/AcrR family transcriptional regulator [Actinoallomurus rhizosphaericola]
MTESDLPLGGSRVQRRLAGAAVELFYRQGALATPVRQITEACDLTPGALYNHFGSKDELLYVLVRDIHLRLEDEVAEAVEAVAGDPLEELRAIVAVYVRRHADHRETARVANREYRLLGGAWYDEIVAIRRRLRDRLADVLLAGHEKGMFRLVGDAGGDGRAAAVRTAVPILDMCVHISEWFHDRHPLGAAELQAHYVELALRMAGARTD